MRTAVTRRNVLVALAVLGGGVGLAGVARLSRSRDRRALDELLSHGDSAARIGELYLRDRPEERDAALLREKLAGSPTEARWVFEEMTPGEMAEWAWDRQREDFERGRTVDVEDWILSQTEARLCALLYLD